MAQTLIEVAKTETDELKRGVIEKFAEMSPIFERLPFQTIEGNAITYNVEDTLPGIGFRDINESYDESTGIINPQTETLKILGGDADTDLALIKTQKDQDRHAIDIAMKVKAATLAFHKAFFDGSILSDPSEFDGLNRRLVSPQVLYAGTNGAALSENFVHRIIDSVDAPSMILMGKQMRRQFQNLFRTSDNLTIVQDTFGRMIPYFRELPIGIIGKDRFGNVVLDFDETRGSSDVTASFYVVSFGEENIVGIQNGTMDVRELGEIDEKPVKRTRIEWLTGMMIQGPYAAARGAGITASVS